MIFKKTQTKNKSLAVQIVFKSPNSPHFPLRGKVGQLRKRKRVHCWSISILLVYDVSPPCLSRSPRWSRTWSGSPWLGCPGGARWCWGGGSPQTRTPPPATHPPSRPRSACLPNKESLYYVKIKLFYYFINLQLTIEFTLQTKATIIMLRIRIRKVRINWLDPNL